MSVETILTWVQNYGIAVAIALYLMYWVTSKLDKKLDALIESCNKLNHNIEKLITLVTQRCRCVSEYG
jgi:hypothetical protein